MAHSKSNSQKITSLETKALPLVIESLLSFSFKHIRIFLLLLYILIYGILNYASNVQIISRLGLPDIVLPRTILNTLVISLMVFLQDHRYRKKRGANPYLQIALEIFVIVIVATFLRMGVDFLLRAFYSSEVNFIQEAIYPFAIFITTLIAAMGSLPLPIIDNWLKRKRLQQNMAKQNLAMKAQQLEAELKFLKSQVHPHFLFNVLNNIYSLISFAPKQAQEVVLQLSGMMQYMLYDSRTDWVPLQRELTYLEQFIALHQLKKDGEMDIDFQISGQIEDWKIPPLLLVPLFENVFKHGRLEDLGEGWMKASIIAKEDLLKIKITNNHLNQSHKDLPGGIGWQNTRERLQLMYPAKHELTIEDDTRLYSVELILSQSGPILKSPI